MIHGAAVLLGAAALLAAEPAGTQDAQIGGALHAGMGLCRAWIDGMVHKRIRGMDFDADRFAADATNGFRLDRVETVPDAMMPAAAKRFATEFWHIDAGADGGIFVIASRLQFACHVVGGGRIDFQPLVIAETSAPAFVGEWQKLDHKEDRAADMASTSYRLTRNGREQLLVSSAIAPGARTDRAQFISTLTYRSR